LENNAKEIISMIPSHLKLPENKPEIISFIFSYLLKNKEIQSQFTFHDFRDSLDFDLSPFGQSNIYPSFFSFFQNESSYQLSQLYVLLSIMKSKASIIFIDAVVKQIQNIISKSKNSFRIHLESYPSNGNVREMKRETEKAYLDAHQLLFNLKFPSLKVSQDNFVERDSSGATYKETINGQVFEMKVLNETNSPFVFTEMIKNESPNSELHKTYYSPDVKVKFMVGDKEFIDKRPCLFKNLGSIEELRK
jgi:hypothetical protein